MYNRRLDNDGIFFLPLCLYQVFEIQSASHAPVHCVANGYSTGPHSSPLPVYQNWSEVRQGLQNWPGREGIGCPGMLGWAPEQMYGLPFSSLRQNIWHPKVKEERFVWLTVCRGFSPTGWLQGGVAWERDITEEKQSAARRQVKAR